MRAPSKITSKAIELNPNYSNAYNDRGLVYNRLNRSAEAIQIIQKRSRPIRLILRLTRTGAVAYYPKIMRAAGKDYEKCIELQPGNADGFLGRANIKNLKQDFILAPLKITAKAIELDPNAVVAYLNRGNAKFIQKDMEGALADFKR